MTEKPVYSHISATILKETDDALEEFCTGRHRGRVARITKSHVIEDALRFYLSLPKIERG